MLNHHQSAQTILPSPPQERKKRKRMRERRPTIALGRNFNLLWLINLVWPSLLLSKVNRVLLGPKRQRGTLHIIRRRRPAYESVLPSPSTLQNVKVDHPSLGLALGGLHSVFCGTEDTDRSVKEFVCGLRRYGNVESEDCQRT